MRTETERIIKLSYSSLKSLLCDSETGTSSVTFSTLILHRTSEHRSEPEGGEAEMADVALSRPWTLPQHSSTESWSLKGCFLSLIISEVSYCSPYSSFKDSVNRVQLLVFKKTPKDKFGGTDCLEEDFASYPAGTCRITTSS